MAFCSLGWVKIVFLITENEEEENILFTHMSEHVKHLSTSHQQWANHQQGHIQWKFIIPTMPRRWQLNNFIKSFSIFLWFLAERKITQKLTQFRLEFLFKRSIAMKFKEFFCFAIVVALLHEIEILLQRRYCSKILFLDELFREG